MIIQERRRNSRNAAMMLDLLHIAVGILVVICAVLVFINPEKNQVLFPVIFFLAALLNGVNGWYRLGDNKYGRKRKTSGIGQCLLSVALAAVGVVSAMSVWR